MSAVPETETPPFIRTQRAFAAHIRDPIANPRPADVEERRMAIYRDLFFNNVESFLSSNFPVLRAITPERRWQGLVRDFFARHHCQTPLFPEIAQEFLDYVQNERGDLDGDPSFLLELAHYEWVELALAVSDADRDAPPADPNGDLMEGIPVLSPLAWNLSYRFPVHRIGPDFLPEQPGAEPTHLVVYRTRQDNVEFLEINAVTQRLIQLLKEYPEGSGQDAVTRIARELNHPQPDTVIAGGRQLLLDLRMRDIILGTRP
jgi:hypothetical protein